MALIWKVWRHQQILCFLSFCCRIPTWTTYRFVLPKKQWILSPKYCRFARKTCCFNPNDFPVLIPGYFFSNCSYRTSFQHFVFPLLHLYTIIICNLTIWFLPEEDVFLLSLALIKVSSICQLREFSLTTVISGILIRDLNQQPDFSIAALWQCLLVKVPYEFMWTEI